MPVTKTTTKKSSRLGNREYKAPPPLRFTDVEGAREHIKKNKLRVRETVRHTRGARINVVYPNGKARTISIELPEEE